MPRYFIHLAYNGKNYHGWQIQDNAHTVQAELNEKISKLLRSDINVIGCGRTDTGVHARDFYAHFDVDEKLEDLNQICYKLNQFLPEDVSVFDLFEVKPDFHSRFSATARTYSYFITRVKDPFRQETAYYYRGPLDIDAMNRSSAFLFNHVDFTSFSKLHTQTATNDCEISQAAWEQQGDLLIFTITADRFLRNMVRAVVGTMMEIGKGKLKPEEMDSIIKAKDRSKAGFSVPAHGLFLEKVTYADLERNRM